jgi:fused signal recognition particle receptor
MGFFTNVKKLWKNPEERAQEALKDYLGDEYQEEEQPLEADQKAVEEQELEETALDDEQKTVSESVETKAEIKETEITEPKTEAEPQQAETIEKDTAEKETEPVAEPAVVEPEPEVVADDEQQAAPVETEQELVKAEPVHEEEPAAEKINKQPSPKETTTIIDAEGVGLRSGDDDRPQWQKDLTISLQQAEPRLSVWLGLILEGIESAGDELWERIAFLLESLEAPKAEADKFVSEFREWLEEMDYEFVDEFKSELQYRLALALELEDEEDERSRLFIKLSEGLNKTKEQITKRIDSMLTSHSSFDDAFWEEFEEILIMADVGFEATMELVERMRERVRKSGETNPENFKNLLRDELEEIFKAPKRIKAYNPPEVVMMIGVNGVGKTTTIAKLAHRAKLQGRKVLIVAGDTFRAAAIGQLEIWAKRVGVGFYAKEEGSDPAAVAYEAMDYAVKYDYDLMLLDTAGRLHTKSNLMDELHKIRKVLGKKHEEAPQRSVLVIDATTGQNALSQTKLFNESVGIDELILTKLDGTAKGGIIISVTMQHQLPITFIGLGEKMEDLRPFNGEDFAKALLGSKDEEE